MGPPHKQRLAAAVIVFEIILWCLNIQAFFLVPHVFFLKGEAVVFRVPKDKDFAALFCHSDKDPCFVGLCQDSEGAAGADGLRVHGGMAGMWGKKIVIATPDQGVFPGFSGAATEMGKIKEQVIGQRVQRRQEENLCAKNGHQF